MKLTAYILASDPGKIEGSVLSYYDLVSRIVVSYDENGRGWTGSPAHTEECLRRLRSLDREKKMVFSPGHYARAEKAPLDNDTFQRQAALNEASEGADWILQIDTDEIIAAPDLFAACVTEAARTGYDAVNYPATWLYAHAGGSWYLCWCRRGWRRMIDYPGPVAVKAGSRLKHCRRISSEHKFFHVDVGRNPSPLAWPDGVAVSKVIRASEGIFHFSWIRPQAWLESKIASWGHHSAGLRDWNVDIERWLAAHRHPIRTSIQSQFIRETSLYHWSLAPVRVPARVDALLEECRPANFPSAGVAEHASEVGGV